MASLQLHLVKGLGVLVRLPKRYSWGELGLKYVGGCGWLKPSKGPMWMLLLCYRRLLEDRRGFLQWPWVSGVLNTIFPGQPEFVLNNQDLTNLNVRPCRHKIRKLRGLILLLRIKLNH